MSRFLFGEGSLSQFLEERLLTLHGEIDGLSGSLLQQETTEQLVATLEAQYRLDSPTIGDDDSIRRGPESEVWRHPSGKSRRTTTCDIFVSFTGDPELFRYRPGTSRDSKREVRVTGSELVIPFDVDEIDGRERVMHEIEGIRENLKSVEDGVGVFNAHLPKRIAERLAQRAKVLSKDKAAIDSLRFPLRHRAATETAIVLPSKRRLLAASTPLSKTDGRPESYLELRNYEDILATLRAMTTVLERSPKSFSKLGEEDLRWILLVALNGLYEGQATGETFNFEGKTDILIRVADRNVFIAECKIWDGAKHFLASIDQLMRYTCWRDTKTALLVFNRGKGLTNTLKAIEAATPSHPQYLSLMKCDQESEFRYRFRHKDDAERELLVSVLVFEVPS